MHTSLEKKPAPQIGRTSHAQPVLISPDHDDSDRTSLESRFIHDFSQVPVSAHAKEQKSSSSTADTEAVRKVLRSPGQPLSPETRTLAEHHFQHDFSHVRVHTDSQAARSAQAMNALAYTVGHNVVFNTGQYAPDMPRGRLLLKHELAHVLQQAPKASHSSTLPASLKTTGIHDPVEQEAERIVSAITAGQFLRPTPARGFHIARQAASATQPGEELLDPFATTKKEETHKQQREELSRLTISIVKDPILAALKRNDAIEFLILMRGLDEDDRRILESDVGFLNELRKKLHGLAMWTTRLILHFGSDRPSYVSQLYLAVSSQQFQQIKDLLRTFNELRDESKVPGVREMLAQALTPSAERNDILRIANEPELARSTASTTYSEVHYEKPDMAKGEKADPGSAYFLKSFTGTANYDEVRTGTELRVIVRIRIVDKSNNAYFLPDATSTKWWQGIEQVWNNHFKAFNGKTRLNIVFVPMFTQERPHQTVTIQPGKERSNETQWYLEKDPVVVAHEFGHMIGNPDEYAIPGSIAEIPASKGISPDDAKRTTVEGITGKAQPKKEGGHEQPGIMGHEDPHAEQRHIWPVLNWYNSKLKPTSEANYH